MKKSENMTKDLEVFEALSNAGRLYVEYLVYQEFADVQSYQTVWNDYYRDMNYPLGLAFED